MWNGPLLKAPGNLWGHPVTLGQEWWDSGTARLQLPGLPGKKLPEVMRGEHKGKGLSPGGQEVGYSPQVSVVLSAQEEGKCQS